MEKNPIEPGSMVAWKEQGKRCTGSIREIFHVTVMTSIKGEQVIKNGSFRDPVYLIENDKGEKALKLYSETEKISAYPNKSLKTSSSLSAS